MTLKRSLLIAVFAGALALPASAQKKEIIQLQTQMQVLQDDMARMQQGFDERMGVMRNLIEQTTDGINKLNASVQDLHKNLLAQNSESGGRTDQISTQIQALNDSVDELKARMNRITKQLEDIAARQETLSAPAPAAAAAPPEAQVLPADVLYNNALRDYNANKLDLALQQFQEYLQAYSTTELAGNAQYYLADIAYKQGQYADAIKEYDKAIEQYPGGNKAAAAQLKKGYAYLELKQRDAGIRELNSLVNRYPRTIEAQQAKERLAKLGAGAISARPSPTRRR